MSHTFTRKLNRFLLRAFTLSGFALLWSPAVFGQYCQSQLANGDPVLKKACEKVQRISPEDLVTNDPTNGIFGGSLYLGECAVFKTTSNLNCPYYFVSFAMGAAIGNDSMILGLNGYPMLGGGERHTGCVKDAATLKTRILRAFSDDENGCNLGKGNNFADAPNFKISPDNILNMKAAAPGQAPVYSASVLGKVVGTNGRITYYAPYLFQGNFCRISDLKASKIKLKQILAAQAETLIQLASDEPQNLGSTPLPKNPLCEDFLPSPTNPDDPSIGTALGLYYAAGGFVFNSITSGLQTVVDSFGQSGEFQLTGHKEIRSKIIAALPTRYINPLIPLSKIDNVTFAKLGGYNFNIATAASCLKTPSKISTDPACSLIKTRMNSMLQSYANTQSSTFKTCVSRSKKVADSGSPSTDPCYVP